MSYYWEDAKQASDTHAYTDSIDTVLYNLASVGAMPPVSPDGTLFGFTSDVLAANGIPLTMLGLPWREVMNNEGKFQAAALFGDVIWHATDKMNVTVGLRYTHDQKEFSWLNGPRQAPELDATIAALQAGGVLRGIPIPPRPTSSTSCSHSRRSTVRSSRGRRSRLKDSWDDLSPRFVIDYKVTPDVMVFGSLAKGYKAGGYNSVQPLSKFDNEDVWNVEAGVKSLFADIGVIVNASVFYYVYQNKQAITLVTAENGVGQYVVDTERRGGLRPRRRCALAADRRADVLGESRVHRRDVQEIHLAVRHRPLGRADRRAEAVGVARCELRVDARLGRQARPVGDVRVPRRVALQS